MNKHAKSSCYTFNRRIIKNLQQWQYSNDIESLCEQSITTDTLIRYRSELTVCKCFQIKIRDQLKCRQAAWWISFQVHFAPKAAKVFQSGSMQHVLTTGQFIQIILLKQMWSCDKSSMRVIVFSLENWLHYYYYIDCMITVEAPVWQALQYVSIPFIEMGWKNCLCSSPPSISY